MTASATKMKYSEMPREMSSDSVVAMRLARGSPCRSPPTKTSSASSTSSLAAAAAAGHASTGGGRRSASAFRSHCLGRKESPEPDGSLDDLFNASGAGRSQVFRLIDVVQVAGCWNWLHVTSLSRVVLELRLSLFLWLQQRPYHVGVSDFT